jgi:hypothetical protein
MMLDGLSAGREVHLPCYFSRTVDTSASASRKVAEPARHRWLQ